MHRRWPDPGLLGSGKPPMRTSASHCTWFPWCREPAVHEVERYLPTGAVRRERVCDRHLPNAREHGFEEPAPGAGDGRAGAGESPPGPRDA